MRTVAQLVSYELPLTTVFFLASLASASFNYSWVWEGSTAHPLGARNNLKPGDMLFFSTNGRGRVSHAGIYLGAAR